jgi:Arm DNA-binding domain
MALTDAKCRAAQPGAKLQKLTDGGGLQLWVQPSGARLWRLAYRFGGKQKLLALGVYPTISLARARQAREDAKRLLANGADPTSEKKRRKQEHTNAVTFRAIADEYLTKLKREGRAVATIAKTEWLLAFADADLGNTPIRSVDAPAVLKVLRAVEIRGRYESARRLRSTIGSVFRYAIAPARADADPTYALRGALIQVKATPRAAITDPKALGALLRAIDAFDGQRVTRIALQLMAFLFPAPESSGPPNGSRSISRVRFGRFQRDGRKCVGHTGCHSQVKRSSCSRRCNCYPAAAPCYFRACDRRRVRSPTTH